MMAGSHVALGAAAWVVAAPHLGLPAASPACLGLALVGSVLPDVDHPKSWLGKRLRPVSSWIAAGFGHRGVTHSAAAVAAWTFLLLHGGAPRWVVGPLAVGYLSHLAADVLTPGGLRLAWPLRGTWALPLCKAGSPFEPLVVAVIVFWAGSGSAVPPLLRDMWARVETNWHAPPLVEAPPRPRSAARTAPPTLRAAPEPVSNQATRAVPAARKSAAM